MDGWLWSTRNIAVGDWQNFDISHSETRLAFDRMGVKAFIPGCGVGHSRQFLVRVIIALFSTIVYSLVFIL